MKDTGIDIQKVKTTIITTIIIGIITFVGVNYIKPLFLSNNEDLVINEVLFTVNPVIDKDSKIVFSVRDGFSLIKEDMNVEVNDIFFGKLAKYFPNSNPPLWSIELSSRKDLVSVMNFGQNRIILSNGQKEVTTNVYLVDNSENLEVENQVDYTISKPVSFDNFIIVSEYFNNRFNKLSEETSIIYSQSQVQCKLVMRGYLIDNNNSILASALTKVLGQNVDDRIREVYKFDLKFKDDELIEVKLDANIESGLYK